MFSNFSCKVTTGTYNLQSVMLNFKSDGVLTSGTASACGFCVTAFASLITFSVKTQLESYLKLAQFQN